MTKKTMNAQARPMKRTKRRIPPPGSLTTAQKDRMFEDDLMYYEGVDDEEAIEKLNVEIGATLRAELEKWGRELDRENARKSRLIEATQRQFGPPDPNAPDDLLLRNHDKTALPESLQAASLADMPAAERKGWRIGGKRNAD